MSIPDFHITKLGGRASGRQIKERNKGMLHFPLYTFLNDLPVSQDSSMKSVKWFGEHMKDVEIRD